MSPDVAAAIPELRDKGILPEGQAHDLLRVARGELLSVYGELRLALYCGVALVIAGVGALVEQNLDRLGPTAIAVGLALAAAAAFAWVQRHAPAFTWKEMPSPHVAFDYVLLLAVLLASADVAYIEAWFTPMGANWPWHLLFASLGMGAIAVRFDSRVVFSLALSTFASWRGVSVSLVESRFWANFVTATRLNTAGCGLLFVLVGLVLQRNGKKVHFEPVATYLGYALLLAALASGALTDEPSWALWASGLLAVGGSLAYRSFFRRRFALFAMGAAATYVAFSRFIVPALDDESLVFLWFLLTSLATIVALGRVHRALRRSS